MDYHQGHCLLLGQDIAVASPSSRQEYLAPGGGTLKSDSTDQPVLHSVVLVF